MAGTQGENEEPLNVPLPVIIQFEAQAEIQEAYLYYEDKAEGLGDEFARVVEAALASITRHPQMYAAVYRQVRRAVLRRFPYSIFYVVEDTRIVVIACFHASRNPRQWKRRV